MPIIIRLLLLYVLQTSRLTVHFFYSPDCRHCLDILREDIPALQERYTFEFKKYDINILDNHKLLEEMEQNVDSIGEDLPIIFVGDSVFYGLKETKEKLPSTIKRYTKVKKPVIKKASTKANLDSVIIKTPPIYLYYFYQIECPECDRFEILLKGMASHYPNLKIYRHDIFSDSSKIFYEALAEKRAIPQDKRLLVPAIFVGEDYLIKDISSTAFEALLNKYQAGSPPLDTLIIDSGEESIFKRFDKFSIGGIITAGFLDGVNPCAVATIIFFVSYLLFIGRRRKDIVLMSVFFIAAVFISYFSIGLGAYNLLKFLSGFTLTAKIIFFVFGIVAIILGILNIYDFFAIRKGKTSKMILQLPLSIKQKIHDNIKEKTKTHGIILGSLVAGFLISFLEFGCTGQVYLPTISFIISRAGVSLKPIFSLLVYNIMFILPLVIIALLAIAWTTKDIGKFLAKRIPVIKILTAILFFGLGILLILTNFVGR